MTYRIIEKLTMIQPYAIPGLKRKPIIKTTNHQIEHIESTICQYLSVSPESVKSKTRLASVVEARHFIFLFLRANTTLSLSEIATRYNRDHTTVIAGVNRMHDLISLEDEVRQKYKNLEQQL